MTDAAAAPDPTSQYPADDEEVPRVHSQDPAEGADPADADQAGADVPRVHAEDPAEGAGSGGVDTTNPQ